VDRSIRLSDSLSPLELRVATTHELCHAADFQLPYRSVDEESWGETRRDRREAFAGLCELGPEVLASYSDCGDGVWQQHAVSISETVFDQSEPVLPVQEARKASVPRDANEEFRVVEVLEGGVLLIGSDTRARFFDIDGGQLAPPPDGFFYVEPETIQAPDGGHWSFDSELLVSGDLAFGLATESVSRMDRADWEPGAFLFAVRPGDVARGIVGKACAEGIHQLFAFEGSVYAVRTTSDRFEWRALSLPE
jgi:hypothetical protein